MANATDASATPTTISPTPSFMNTLTLAMVAAVFIKLDRTNYSLWLAQSLPIFRSRDLMGFVDGYHECPPKHLSGSTTVNPAYTTWIQQNQLILSWINNSLSQSVLSTVSRNQTSRSTWLALERRYASTSQNRILHLRNELIRTMKGDLSVSDYLDKIAAQARDTPITYPTLESLLLNTERRMNDHVSSLTEYALAVAAFAANRGRGGGRSRGTGRGGVLSNRGVVPNSRGGTARGSFTNQRAFL
ncbi:unnamed protein product [Prunus armeniaca]